MSDAVERLRHVIAESDDLPGALVFGSFARGDVGPESDLDVVLVTTEPADGDPGRRYARFVERLALGVPCDLLIYEPEALRRAVEERPFLARAIREGFWIGDAAASP